MSLESCRSSLQRNRNQNGCCGTDYPEKQIYYSERSKYTIAKLICAKKIFVIFLLFKMVHFTPSSGEFVSPSEDHVTGLYLLLSIRHQFRLGVAV